MDTMRGASPTKGPVNADSPEQLLDAFKAAALSVTKLYKTSAAAQSKARSDGYQDCLDDLLVFLDKQSLGLSDGEGWQIRKWATERLDGRNTESDDEVEKAETASSPELHRPSAPPQQQQQLQQQQQHQQQQQQQHIATRQHDAPMRTDSAPPTTHAAPVVEEPQPISVPSQENFTFQSSYPYPQESTTYLNIDKLDLSDAARPNDNATSHNSSSTTHTSRSRGMVRRLPRPRASGHGSGHLGKGAGQKRPINFAELFDVGNIGIGKDMFGRDGKRSRHT